jgi:hypothetical protein
MKKERKNYTLSDSSFIVARVVEPGWIIRKKRYGMRSFTIPDFTSMASRERNDSGENFYTRNNFRDENDKKIPEIDRIRFEGVRVPQKTHDFEQRGVENFSKIDCRFLTAGKKISETLAERFETRCRVSEGRQNFSEGHRFISTGRSSEVETREIFSEGLNV